MPTYDYECKHCKADFVWVSSVGERGKAACPGCGATGADVERIFDKSEPNVQADILPYYDNGAGRWFRSRTERKAWMKGQGCEEIGNDSGVMNGCKENLERCREAKRLKMSM